MVKKYLVITYGCQMNKSDSERIATVLEKIGYKPALKIEEADLIVANMCSVRQSAVDRIFGLFPKFKKLKIQNPKLKTILTGCILKEDKKKFQKHFDLILNIKDLSNWPKYFQKNKKGNRENKRNNGDYCVGDYFFDDYFRVKPKYQNNSQAYIPISKGCNNFCSYCVVPFTRGKEVSRSITDIVKEVKNLIEKGYKEIVLLGQNVNSYKFKIQNSKFKMTMQNVKLFKNQNFITFPILLQILNNLPGNFKIGFLTSHPKDFSDELIEVIAQSKKIKKEIHLPVQSGDDEILKKMNRGYTVKQYKNLIKKIRRKIPDIKLSTDVIVGFPGETKKQFENTVKLFKEIKFDMAYIAKYSPRPGTAAAKLKDNVSLQEKKRRWQILKKLINSKTKKR